MAVDDYRVGPARRGIAGRDSERHSRQSKLRCDLCSRPRARLPGTRQAEKALGLFERGVARNPNFLPNHVYRIFALEALGRTEEAAVVREDLSQLFPNYEFSAAYLFYYETEQL